MTFDTLDAPATARVDMDEPPLWMQGAVYPAGMDRELITAAVPTAGVFGNGLRVVPRRLGANMSVDVLEGRCTVEGSDAPGQGMYLCRSHETVNLAVGAAPGAGLSRIDIIVARVYDDAVTGEGRNVWALEVIPGVPAASPAAPDTPPSALGLAFVIIPSGLAAIIASTIGDVRLPNGPFRVRWSRSSGVIGGSTVFGCTPQVETLFYRQIGGSGGHSLQFKLRVSSTLRSPCGVPARTTTSSWATTTSRRPPERPTRTGAARTPSAPTSRGLCCPTTTSACGGMRVAAAPGSRRVG
jgi:hypothetical protein